MDKLKGSAGSNQTYYEYLQNLNITIERNRKEIEQQNKMK